MTAYLDISNKEFLQCIFGQSYPYAHVTSFNYDPNEIPADKRAYAWAGGYYKDTPVESGNQFYTVSLFTPDERGRSRRRKATFSGCYVIGLDDVKEKLDVEQVKRLPEPTIVLKSSLHSEQWLYVLDKPCQDMNMIDNLHDGLITRGLAPDSKDPGQKGVTRYLRLPEGVNTKAKRIKENDGVAPRCQVLVFEPNRRYTMEQLAAPFDVDLHAVRRSTATEGASDIPDHPLLHTPHLNIKQVLSDGRFDITCPWVDEHTDQDDSGTAIFTNEDGTLGFKCHHGNCEGKTGKHLMQYLENKQPGFSRTYNDWQAMRVFNSLSSLPKKEDVPPPPPQTPQQQVEQEQKVSSVADLINELRRMNYTLPEARDLAAVILKQVDSIPHIDRLQYHNDIADIMHWTKTELSDILKDARSTWYSETKSQAGFYQEVMYVGELNQYFNYRKQIFYTHDAFVRSFIDQDEDVGKNSVMGMTDKVDRLDYLPKGPRVWEEDGVIYGNSYVDSGVKGNTGDASPWINHFDVLGWGENKDHVLDWMAYTVQHPEKKINHMILFGGGEGIGKDFLLYPLTKAMGRNSKVINGDQLLSQFNDYLFNTKYLHINETELGDHKDATTISNKLKPLATAPPETLGVNPKGTKMIYVRNIVNCTMATNSLLPFKAHVMSRRYYALWSDLNMRDATGQMKEEWTKYWVDMWNWMENGGLEMCIHHLETRDLSNFLPQSAPPVTEFLQDIVDRSKPPTQQTVEAFLNGGHGAFGNDMATIEELLNTIKAGEQFNPEIMYTKAEYYNPQKLATILKTMGKQKKRLRSTIDGKTRQLRVWMLRNEYKYESMEDYDIIQEYDNRDKTNRGVRAV